MWGFNHLAVCLRLPCSFARQICRRDARQRGENADTSDHQPGLRRGLSSKAPYSQTPTCESCFCCQHQMIPLVILGDWKQVSSSLCRICCRQLRARSEACYFSVFSSWHFWLLCIVIAEENGKRNTKCWYLLISPGCRIVLSGFGWRPEPVRVFKSILFFGRLQCCIQQVPIRAFMDDLTVTARSVPEGRWILEDLVEITKAARMEFKPPKSRSLVLRRGYVRDRFHFKIGEDVISTVWAGGTDPRGRGSGSRTLAHAVKPHWGVVG